MLSIFAVKTRQHTFAFRSIASCSCQKLNKNIQRLLAAILFHPIVPLILSSLVVLRDTWLLID
jgi:hypothetical protein